MLDLEKILYQYEETTISHTMGGWGVSVSPVFMSTTIPTFMASAKTLREAVLSAHESAQTWRKANGYTEYWSKRDV